MEYLNICVCCKRRPQHGVEQQMRAASRWQPTYEAQRRRFVVSGPRHGGYKLVFFMSCAAAASVAVYRWRHAPARGGACATGVPRDSSSAARGTEAMRADTQRGWGRQIVGPIVPRWELSWLSCDVPMWLQAGTQTGLAPSIWSPAVASELSSGLVSPAPQVKDAAYVRILSKRL